jgi:hypothetical protein
VKPIPAGLRKIAPEVFKVRLPHLLGQRLLDAGFQVHPEPRRLVLYRLVDPPSGTEVDIYFNAIQIRRAPDLAQCGRLLRAINRGELVSTAALGEGGAM